MRELLVITVVASLLGAQTTLFVPQSFAASDAPSIQTLAALAHPGRQQIVIDAVHLNPSVPKNFTALLFRRDWSVTRAFSPAEVWLTVTLARCPTSAVSASRLLGTNLGASPTIVFQGPLRLPYSPGTASRTVGWDTQQDAVRIAFTTPFPYTSDSLCIDLLGYPVLETFWAFDAACDQTLGRIVRVGQACGPQATSIDPRLPGNWASATPTDLLPGATANFTAVGSPGNPAVLLIGNALLPVPLDLASLGIGENGCLLYVDPLISLVTQFGPSPFTGILYGDAQFLVPLPFTPNILGASFPIQWIEASGLRIRSSEAILCTVAPLLPSFSTSLLTANSPSSNPDPNKVMVEPGRTYVMRLDY